MDRKVFSFGEYELRQVEESRENYLWNIIRNGKSIGRVIGNPLNTSDGMVLQNLNVQFRNKEKNPEKFVFLEGAARAIEVYLKKKGFVMMVGGATPKLAKFLEKRRGHTKGRIIFQSPPLKVYRVHKNLKEPIKPRSLTKTWLQRMQQKRK